MSRAQLILSGDLSRRTRYALRIDGELGPREAAALLRLIAMQMEFLEPDESAMGLDPKAVKPRADVLKLVWDAAIEEAAQAVEAAYRIEANAVRALKGRQPEVRKLGELEGSEYVFASAVKPPPAQGDHGC